MEVVRPSQEEGGPAVPPAFWEAPKKGFFADLCAVGAFMRPFWEERASFPGGGFSPSDFLRWGRWVPPEKFRGPHRAL